MNFAHYKEAAATAADLVNTLGSVSGYENLPDAGSLGEFLLAHGLEPPAGLDEGDVADVRGLRARLKEIFFTEDESEMAGRLNRLLDDYRAQPQLAGEPGNWKLVHASGGCTLAQELATTFGVALSELLMDSGRARIGFCSADNCLDVFVDTSRNRSRRYCEDSCSSRQNVKAFRARQHSH
ncbi:MAG TPA: CGNR zinc finger domain-containing protein [Actinomycetota bacterium]|nr:CGNR zinc finger domain-containing protein [Actinomycetota bacterium]